MLRHSIFALLLASLAALAFGGAAKADFTACNRSAQRIDVALGYPHAQFGWTSEGWWTLQPGRCRRLLTGQLTNQFYYLYATGSSGGRWEARAGQDGGFFCIQSARFVFPNRNYQNGNSLACAAANLEARQFFIVNTQGAPNHRHNFAN